MNPLLTASLFFLLGMSSVTASNGKGKGKGKKQDAAELAAAHMAALSACDIEKLVSLRDPEKFVLYLPVDEPRNVDLVAAEQGWVQYCGGLAGTTWTIQYMRELKDSVVVGWEITGPLIEPNVGHDVFFEEKGLIVGQVTTFEFDELVFV